ncbi:hypothetical protein C8F04DRAFT_303258 [Mycena alexandri]|uniref:GIT Spa2 homology (SHD) domain-containing protein n=1 Tax=Mycena alexandri TaxID=1745969 RepID=A0AAD6S6Z3_9AGAR|nr:hypothetical protein C8F04DRAFT_303258 [Mycena alexandri]
MPSIDYRAVSEVHFNELARYLASYLANHAAVPRFTERQKLARLTIQRFFELSADVYDEVSRRENIEEGTPLLKHSILPSHPPQCPSSPPGKTSLQNGTKRARHSQPSVSLASRTSPAMSTLNSVADTMNSRRMCVYPGSLSLTWPST